LQPANVNCGKTDEIILHLLCGLNTTQTVLNDMLILLAASSTANNRDCKACQHGARITMSSSYANKLIKVPAILQPKFNVVTLSIRSRIYKQNKNGDKIPRR